MLHYGNLVECKRVVLKLGIACDSLYYVVSLNVVPAFVYDTDDIINVFVRGCGEESKTPCVYAKNGNLLAADTAGCAKQCAVTSETYCNVSPRN